MRRVSASDCWTPSSRTMKSSILRSGTNWPRLSRTTTSSVTTSTWLVKVGLWVGAGVCWGFGFWGGCCWPFVAVTSAAARRSVRFIGFFGILIALLDYDIAGGFLAGRVFSGLAPPPASPASRQFRRQGVNAGIELNDSGADRRLVRPRVGIEALR